MEPRVVLVTRPTEYDGLLARHSTHGQAAWYLSNRGQDIATAVHRHAAQRAAVDQVLHAIPGSWRHTRIGRADLDRFLFEPEDIVIAVGQDGLVPNVAKYLHGQPVIGVNPDPDRYEGVLVRHPAETVRDLLRRIDNADREERTMIEAVVSDGQTLVALNEIFIGHRSHQSARYTLNWQQRQEQHSSSGVIVASGTGATGWARSIHRCHRSSLCLPAPTDPGLVFFVREPWPSVATQTDLNEGYLEANDELVLTSQMNEGGVLFGDGIEGDHVTLDWAATVRVRAAKRQLVLIC